MAKGNKLSGLMKKTTACDVPMSAGRMSEEDKARQRRYQAEDAIRTLQRAQEIQKDRALMRDVKIVAREQMKQLQSVTSKPASGRR